MNQITSSLQTKGLNLQAKLRTFGKPGFLVTLCWLVAFLVLSLPAAANPSGPQVRHGNVHITPGTQTQIQQLTNKAIIDWKSFSIGSGEAVRFLQPSDLSVVLNRVTGGDASSILGQLEANGNVFLINPNGVLFGPGSVVNVGGLVVSTLNISNEDFLSGNYRFVQDPNSELAAIVNQGKIRITDAGYAVLTGPTVINEGSIIAKSGKITLASGEVSTLNLDGRDLVHFELGTQNQAGAVILPSGMLTEALNDVLGVHSTSRANQLVKLPDGSIRLQHGSGVLVQNGEIRAEGQAGQRGGNIQFDSSDLTILGKDSVTSTSGRGAESDGGEILVLSAMDGSRSQRGFTDVQAGAQLESQGGTSGDGGFIEVSGDLVTLQGDLDLSASNGEVGHFLLDPILVRIIDGVGGAFANPITGTTDITDGLLENMAADFTLESFGDILFDVSATSGGVDNGVDFSLGGAARNVTFLAGTDPGDVGGINLGSDELTGLLTLTLVADGDINLGTGRVTASDAVIANATNGNVDFSDAVIDPTEMVDVTASGTVNLGSSNITIDGPSLTPLSITAGQGIDIGSSSLSVTYNGNGVSNANFNTLVGDIRFDQTTIDTSVNGSGALNVTLDSASDIRGGANDPDFNIQDGNLTMSAGSDIEVLSGFFNLFTNNSFDGALSLNAGNDLTLGTPQILTFPGISTTASLVAASDISLGQADMQFSDTTVTITAPDVISLEQSRLTASNGDVTISATGRQLVVAGTPQFDENGVAFVDPATGILDLGGTVMNDTGVEGENVTYNVENELRGNNHSITSRGDNLTINVKRDVTVDRLGLFSDQDITLGNDPSRLHTNTGSISIDELRVAAPDTPSAGSLTILAGLDLTILEGNVNADNVDLSNGRTLPTVADPMFTGSEMRLGRNATGALAGLIFTVDETFNADSLVFRGVGGLEIDASDIVIDTGGILEMSFNSVYRPLNSMTLTSRGPFGLIQQEVDSEIQGDGATLLFDGGRLEIDGLTSSTEAIFMADNFIAFDGGSVKAADNVDLLIGDAAGGTHSITFSGDAFDSGSGHMRNSIQSSDIDVFAFLGGDPPDVESAVLGDVRLNVAAQDVGQPSLDVSINARGNVTIEDFSHLGGLGGTTPINIERLGFENPGDRTDLAGLIVSTGNLIIRNQQADLTLGTGQDLGTAPLIDVQNANSQTIINTGRVLDRNDGVGLTTDILSQGEVRFDVKNSVGERINATSGVEVQARDIIVNGAGVPGGGTVTLGLVPGNDFLEFISDALDAQVRDTMTGQTLSLTPNAGTAVVGMSQNASSLGSSNVLIRHSGDVAVGRNVVTSGQTFGIEVNNGGQITSDIASGAGNENFNSNGSVILVSNGSIGNQAQSLFLTGGVVSAQAGATTANQAYLESSAGITVGTSTLVNGAGATRLTRSGVTAGGDIEIASGNTGDINLQAATTSGTGIALRNNGGNLVQGAAGSVTAPVVALDISGDAGNFDGTNATGIISLNVNTVVVDVTQDALIRKGAGDLSVIPSTTIGGVNYNTTGTGQDLRIQVDLGTLSIDSTIAAGGDAAFVTGAALTISPQGNPNSVVINGPMSAGNNLNIISQADIDYVSGSVTAPNLGLGAAGTVGSPTAPVVIDTDNLALRPGPGNVDDIPGGNSFNFVGRVDAVGTSVLSNIVGPGPGGGPGPVPPPTPPPTPAPAPVATIPNPNPGGTPSIPQNNTDLVEDDLEDGEGGFDPFREIGSVMDPSVPILGWWDDEDLLRKKFRRQKGVERR